MPCNEPDVVRYPIKVIKHFLRSTQCIKCYNVDRLIVFFFSVPTILHFVSDSFKAKRLNEPSA